MAYFYLVLLYLGFGGSLLLLGTSSIPRLAALRKPMAATTVTLVTLVWGLSPQAGRWVLSVWTPSSVTGGWLVLDTDPALWWSVLAILATFTGVLWVTVGERSNDLAFTGTLALVYLTVVWLVMTSGSLLLTLAMWATIDIIWFLVRLTDTADGERVVWAAAVGGGASVLLWIISLFLLTEGTSGLWWLMRPSSSLTILLTVAGAMRMGLYPFQVVHAETWGYSRVLTLASALSPLTGISLLYRLLAMPMGQSIPAWFVTWAAISMLWLGVKALMHQGRAAVLPAAYGLLLAVVTGAVVGEDARGLAIGAGVWVAGLGVLALARRYHRRTYAWTWPTIVGLLTLVGAPPSPLFRLYCSVFANTPWWLQVVSGLGLMFSIASLVRGVTVKAPVRVGAPSPFSWLPMAAGFGILTAVLAGMSWVYPVTGVPAPEMALWATACLGGLALAFWGGRLRISWGEARAVLEIADLKWLYRSTLQGTTNLLSVVRAAAEVVEGRGSILWSIVILLLVLMLVGYR